MRFSIQEQNQPKQFFHFIPAAQKETGIANSIIKSSLERNNPRYHRKSDDKIVFIQKEDKIKILTIDGEDFFSLEEIKGRFCLSPTKFLNQLKNKSFFKKVDWISPELFSSRGEDKVDSQPLPEKVLPPVPTRPVPLPRTKKIPPVPLPRTKKQTEEEDEKTILRKMEEKEEKEKNLRWEKNFNALYEILFSWICG